MIGIEYTIENQSGDSIVINDHTTNPSQIIALQSYPQFDIDVKNNEINRAGQHGIWDFFSYYGRRNTTFSGVIVGDVEADVVAVKNKLIKVLAFPAQPIAGRDGTVTIKWTDINGDSWQMEGKLLNTIQFNRNMKEIFRLDFNLSIKSADSFIVSQILQSLTGTRGYYQTGAMFPLALPALLGVVPVNKLSVDNDGSAYAQTLIRIYGEAQQVINNPILTNLTTGDFLELTATLTDETKYIEIDSQDGTIVDQDGNDLSGAITGDSNFIQLQQGINEILYTSDEDPDITGLLPTASFNVKFRSTRI